MLGARVLVVDEIIDVEGDDELKCIKLKTGRLESQNLTKFRKISKLGKSKGEKSKKPS